MLLPFGSISLLYVEFLQHQFLAASTCLRLTSHILAHQPSFKLRKLLTTIAVQLAATSLNQGANLKIDVHDWQNRMAFTCMDSVG